MKDLIPIGLKSTEASDAGRISDGGFTLIELLVTMVIASILMAAIYSVYAGLTRSYTTQNAAADMQQAVRATIDFMAEDIMMAGLTNPEKNYAADVGISEAGITTITFNADRNMDGDTLDEFEDLTYWLDGTELKQKDNNTGNEDPFIDHVIDLEFRYFRENDTDTPTNNDLYNDSDATPKDLIKGYGYEDPTDYLDDNYLSDIRTVEISITVEEPAGREREERMKHRTYTTRVRCRNAGI